MGGATSGPAASNDHRSDATGPGAGGTIHASAVLVGARAVLVRGAAGSGKSRLVLELLQAAADGRVTFAKLVADDRVLLAAAHGRLIARPPARLAGLLEIRGLGIRRLPHEPLAAVGLVVDLAAAADRMPEEAAREVVIERVRLPRLAVAAGTNPFPLVLAALTWGRSRPEAPSLDLPLPVSP